MKGFDINNNNNSFIKIAIILNIIGIIAAIGIFIYFTDFLAAILEFIGMFLFALVYYGIGRVLEELEDIKKALKSSEELNTNTTDNKSNNN